MAVFWNGPCKIGGFDYIHKTYTKGLGTLVYDCIPFGPVLAYWHMMTKHTAHIETNDVLGMFLQLILAMTLSL
jgi:hypothetical protein